MRKRHLCHCGRCSPGLNKIQVNPTFFQQFVAATSLATFAIFLEFFYTYDRKKRANELKEFTAQNPATNEHLAVRNAIFEKQAAGPVYYVEVLRHPIGADASMRELVKEWAIFEKKYDFRGEQEQVISVAGPSLTIG